jgi:hypothetical protein
MPFISSQEADQFASYSSRLTEIDNQLDLLSEKTTLTDNEKELIKNLINEKNQIAKWFNETSK